MMMAETTAQTPAHAMVVLRLRQWAEDESNKCRQFPFDGESREHLNNIQILRRTTVAYGVARLMKQARSRAHHSSGAVTLNEQLLSIDNFTLRMNATARMSHPCSDIEGVDMISPSLSVNITDPSFLRDDVELSRILGRYVETELLTGDVIEDAEVFFNQSEEDEHCHMFGVLMYELFFQSSGDRGGGAISAVTLSEHGLSSDDIGGDQKLVERFDDASIEPARKKSQRIDLRAHYDVTVNRITSEDTNILNDVRQERYGACAASVVQDGFPSSLCLVIQNLLECEEDSNRPDNAYDCLEAVTEDLHLLLLDPERFLFDNDPTNYDTNGRIMPSFREHTLYGRDNEVMMITEAFCRVSGGDCESLFIGGFSGSGKSRLVNDLTERLDAVGGYVLKHKFDQIMSKGRSMLEIIALFNELCLLIIEKNTKPDVLALVDDLIGFFGSDLSSLAQLLPNIRVLAPHLDLPMSEQESASQTNLRSICYTLQQFIGVVSSAVHPVVLFLDDMQWCDNSVFTVVESIFGVANRLHCLFFVGAFRSNEVADDHEIFRSAKRLKSSGVPTTMMSLEGLQPTDLNTMISDALCVFPRISEPLSDIVFQKTKGNPFFVLAFLRSLVERGLLNYNINLRRWLWDEDDVSAMDVTGNVLHLLSFKMTGLSTSIQSTLKTAACFGIKIDQGVVALLAIDPEYVDIQDMMKQVVKEGFTVQVGTSHYRFVHDKVREAAYSLISDEERDKYHYSIGKSLYLSCKGKDVDGMILISIADQMRHCIADMGNESPESKIDIAKLYDLSGKTAMGCSDYAASRLYLNLALSLLPTDRWETQFELCHQISLRLAKSVYSCGDLEEAQSILQDMLEKCRSFEDKVPVQAMLVTMHISGKRFMIAYDICREVLSQIGENIPDKLYLNQSTHMTKATLRIVSGLSEKDLLEMKEMDSKLATSMSFYSLMSRAAFLAKPEMVPFLACRSVQRTMENGLCKHSISGFLVLAALRLKTMIEEDIDIGSKVGKAAVSCFTQRYNTSELIPETVSLYYGFVAWQNEPLQICVKKLRQGFEVGMSVGDSDYAFNCAVQYGMNSIQAGDRLSTVMKLLGYYMQVANTYQHHTNLIFSIYLGAITIMIGGGDSSPYPAEAQEATPPKILVLMYFYSALQAYWQGYNERSQHYVDKMLAVISTSTVDVSGPNSAYIMFISGLNSVELMKIKCTGKLKSSLSKAFKFLQMESKHSSWNFQNKVQLLEAERFSHKGKRNEAKASYIASISSALASGFIHEQGLACELAGNHCKKMDDISSARNFYIQAQVCYKEWGSQMRVDRITRQLVSLPDDQE